MSILSVYHASSPALPNKVLTHLEDIASTLAEQGIGFSRLPATTPIKAGASHHDVLDAYRVQVDQIMTENGLSAVEVISVDGAHAHDAQWRAGLLVEHRHDTDELRLIIAGRGLLSLHIGEFVYAVLCEKNDLIAVPAGTRQWFDLGEQPRLIALRLFKDTNGQQSSSTGDALASEFPRLDD